jgi:tetratricopeptide (TPR) repeat protein
MVPKRLLQLLFLALLCSAPAALAQPVAKPSKGDLAKAEELFNLAERYYNVGNYKDALEYYKQSYLLSGFNDLLFNFGQCQRQLGLFEDAAKSYRSFLRSLPEKDPRRPSAEKILQEVEELLAKQKSVTEAPPVGTTPDPTTAAAVTPAGPEQAPPGGERAGAGPSPLLFYGGAAAAGVGGFVFGGLSLSAARRSADAADGVPFGDAPDLEGIAAERRKAFALATVSTGLFVAAVASGGAGFLLPRLLKKADASVSIVPGGVVGGVRW